MLRFTRQVFVLDADARGLTTFEAPGAAGDAGAARLPRPRVVALVEGKAVPQASHFTEHRRALQSPPCAPRLRKAARLRAEARVGAQAALPAGLPLSVLVRAIDLQVFAPPPCGLCGLSVWDRGGAGFARSLFLRPNVRVQRRRAACASSAGAGSGGDGSRAGGAGAAPPSWRRKPLAS